MPLERGVKRHYLLIVSIILIGVASSIAAFVASRNRDYQKLHLSFESAAEHRYETLRRGIGGDLATLESLQALFASSDHVPRSQFKDFAKHALSSHPGIQALEWIPRVAAEERESYDRAARQDGFRSFQIREAGARGKMERASNREESFPVYYLEPYHGNEAALGFDLGSDLPRRNAMEEARDTGLPIASERPRLVQEGAGQFGFLVFLPAYRSGVPIDTVDRRRANLRGFVLGVFRIADMLETTLQSVPPDGISCTVLDITSPLEPQPLYHRSSRPLPANSGPGAAADQAAGTQLRVDRRLDVANRQWLFTFTGDPDYAASDRTWHPSILLFGGLVITGLVAMYLFTNVRYVRSLSAINSRLREEAVERTRMECALRESEDLYRSLFDNMLNGLAYCKMDFNGDVPMDFTYIEVNGAFERLTGLSGVVGKRVSEVIPGIRESSPQLFEVYGRVALTGTPERLETWVEPLAQWFSISVYSPGKEHFVALFDVITERKRAEEHITRLASFPEMNPAPVLEVDDSGEITFFNPAAQEAISNIGSNKEDLKVLLPRDLHRMFAEWDRNNELIVNREATVGDAVFYETIHFIPVFNVVRVYATDITKARRAEEAVKKSEATLKSVLSASPVGIALCRNDRAVDWINDRLTAMTGYTLAEVRGKVPTFLYPSSDEFLRIEEELYDPIRLGDVGIAEMKWIHKDGTLHDVHVRGAAIDPQDMSAGIVFTATDITEQKRADDLLRESEERYRIAIENSNDGVALARKDELIFVNHRFLEMSGYDREEEVLHMDSSLFVHPTDRERVRLTRRNENEGEPVPARYEFRAVRKDGTELDIEASVASILFPGGPRFPGPFQGRYRAQTGRGALAHQSERSFRMRLEIASISST